MAHGDWAMMRWVHRATTSLMMVLVGMTSATVVVVPYTALAQDDPYKQHMDNGIKLFQDKNYEAAIAEFRAAYKANPRASPLFNIALSQKALFRYPNAIATLELALAKHRDTMDDNDAKVAQEAIEEMRALLAQVIVEVTPQHATLVVDGEVQSAVPTAKRLLELGPGTHHLQARADGYATAEQSVTVVSGERDKVVMFSLVADQGYVTVDAQDPQTAIAIDQKFVGYGRYVGFLPPGTHLVQIYRSTGLVYAAHIQVVAGKSQEIRPGFGGIAVGDMQQPPSPPIPPPPPRPVRLLPTQRGWFVLVSGSLLWPGSYPLGFPEPRSNSGGAGKVRGGYRVNNAASFDLMLQYANVGISSETNADLSYTFESGRVGLNLRLMTPGRSIRLVGSLGGGLAYDSLSFAGRVGDCDPACVDASGVDPFVFADVGVEFDFGGALLGGGVEGYFQSTRGIERQSPTADEAYAPSPLVHLGFGVHAGYAFW